MRHGLQPLHRHLLVPFAIFAVTLGACASDNGGEGDAGPTGAAAAAPSLDEVEVRPFSEIQDGPVAFEADPFDPSSGIFRVTTTEPAICAIVWGETDQFGRFNNRWP